MLLEDIFVPDKYSSTSVIGLDGGVIGLIGQRCSVRPDPLAAQQEEGRLVLGIPFVHSISE